MVQADICDFRKIIYAQKPFAVFDYSLDFLRIHKSTSFFAVMNIISPLYVESFKDEVEKFYF